LVPNVVTAARCVLTPPFVWLVWRGASSESAFVAVLIFTAVAGSDFLDGLLARRLDAVSPRGRLFDHAADVCFILSAFAAYVLIGVVPWWVPAAIAVSVLAYALDSLRGPSVPLKTVAGRVGHVGGVLNYALVGTLTLNETAALGWLSREQLAYLFVLVPVYSGGAVLLRVLAGRPGRCHGGAHFTV
jgi:phosphatidylglycerophosphate synthase